MEDIIWSDVAEGFVIAAVVVVIHKAGDSRF
jgi:hypothetical protein